MRLLRAVVRLGIPVHVGHHMPDAILAADEVVICNSLLGARRIAVLDGVALPSAGWATLLNDALYEELD
jgi:4-amino-4-deoxychorismate lyase